jgi:hypothetical protein
MDLITFGQVGGLVAAGALLVAILFLALRSRRSPGYAAGVALLGLALGGALTALATESVACQAITGGECFTSDAYRPKTYLLWALSSALLIALARAPWRRV